MKDIDTLLTKFYDGRATVEDVSFLVGIINDEKNGQFDDYCRKKWQNPSYDIPSDVKERIITAMLAEIAEEERIASRRSWKKRGYVFLQTISVAAVLLIAVLVGKSVSADREPEIFKMAAERGQKSSLTLPDGSRVWLNSASTILYTSDYNSDERNVFLQGEAYFEVAENPDLAFVVHAQDVSVEALGTKFNVKAYAEDQSIITTLVEGKVKTSVGEISEILLPEQQAYYDKRTGTMKKSDVDDPSHIIPWMKNEILLMENSLAEIAVVLERMYNVTIIFDEDDIGSYTYTGLIRNNSLPNVLELISTTSPVTYRMSESTIRFSRKN